MMKRIKTRIPANWDAIEIAVPVHFSEVDSMKLVWHGHYIRYCESAREAYCRERGLSYQQMEDENCIAPVVRVQIEYLAPARMGQTVRVRCAHLPGSEPMLNLFYEIHGPEPAGGGVGKLLCIAETVQVFIDLAGQPYLSSPPPVARMFAAIAARERELGSTGSPG